MCYLFARCEKSNCWNQKRANRSMSATAKYATASLYERAMPTANNRPRSTHGAGGQSGGG